MAYHSGTFVALLHSPAEHEYIKHPNTMLIDARRRAGTGGLPDAPRDEQAVEKGVGLEAALHLSAAAPHTPGAFIKGRS